MKNLRNNKGFTLIELMIVVVIIGILAAIAIPKFSGASQSAKQSEADGILKQIYTLQEAHFAKEGKYGDEAALVLMGYSAPTSGNTAGGDLKYFDTPTIATTGTDATGFTACMLPSTLSGKGLKAAAITQARKIGYSAADGDCTDAITNAAPATTP